MRNSTQPTHTNHEDNLMRDATQPMNTLDKFDYRELAELNTLINAYTNAGTHDNGKIYAELPATWCDEIVYPDFNPDSGMVFLSNSDYQTLVNTEYGVMQWYNTPYKGFEGTLFDLAEAITHDLTDKDGNTTPAGAGNWHKDDLNAVYFYFDSDIVALRDTGADLTDLYRAKERIAQTFILDALHDQPFNQAELDHYSDEELITRCLSDFDHDIADEDDLDKYAEFIRTTAKAMLDAE